MTICELVAGDIDARAALGMKRYGKPLEPGSVRDALQNAYEESLDQAIYLKQALLSLDGSTPAVSQKGTALASEPSEGSQSTPDVSDLSCAKCGASFESKRHKGQHGRWCGTGKAPASRTPPIVQTGSSSLGFPLWPCPFKCGKTTGSRQGTAVHAVRCEKNPQRKVWSTRSGERSLKPLAPGSTCCHAATKSGPRHSLGNQYCTQCGNACTWAKGPKLAPGANKSFICIGMTECPRLTEYKDGYCLPCWEKRRPKASDVEQEILDELNSNSPADE